MQTREENPYEVLGIDKDASSSDIKKAYFQNVRKFSPEKHGDKFKNIRAAYEQLKDEKQRAETDIFLLNVPYKEFVIEQAEKDYQYKPKIDLDAFQKHISREFSDLERTDFRDDFTEVD